MKNLEILENKYNEIINLNVNYITRNIKKGHSFVNIIKPNLKKCFIRLTYIELKACILLNFLKKTKNQSQISKIISNEIKDINNFEQSLIKCENLFNLLWQELEILINLLTK